MKRLLLGFALAAALLVLGPSVAGAKQSKPLSLDMYRAIVTQAEYADLLDKGYDIAAADVRGGGKVELEIVLDASQVSAIRKDGVNVQVLKNAFGVSARQFAALQAANGFTVWRDYDSPDGFRAQLYQIAAENPAIAKLKVVGRSGQGREILALKLSKDARQTRDGKKPAVLYSALQHSREWIAGEVNIRLLRWYIDRWNANDPEIRELVRDTELWFIPVANPDGYQYTFQSPGTRLWRKTLTDNNGNGTIEVGDGVDPNRNFPEHWGYDNEGSSSTPSSDTYRGPNTESEPETTAMMQTLKFTKAKFQVNYHSFGEWLLYPEGWQIGTPSQDDPIYFALSGNLDNPAIEGFNPGISSDVLYVTNGETTDYAHTQEDTLAWTPELDEGCDGCGFVFPDDEALVQAEFERNIPFALSVAQSAGDPDDPKSSLGIQTKPFYLKSDDTYKTGLPQANFTFEVSYGDPQQVRVLAKRDLSQTVMLKYRINGGKIQSGTAPEWQGGERYGSNSDVYYVIRQGEVRGTKPGDTVQVWFESGNVKSDSFTYTAAVESKNRVLIMAAEDYSGASPVQTPGPHYLSFYEDALKANGIGYDVYDVDARGRKAPSPLGVLSHYDAVIWYTGDDIITREPGWPGGNASRLAMDEILNVRDYLNEGGKVFFSGSWAGIQYSANQQQLYDPTAANAQCSSSPAVAARCLILFGSTSSDLQNDVLEYWFGAYLINQGAGQDADGNTFGILGVDTPFSSLSLLLNGADSADNQAQANSFITTSGILPPSEFPQFNSWPSLKYDRPGGPFDPHTGDSYAYSQIADVSFKSLSRTVSVPGGGGNLSFWTSYNTEPNWDFLFVEARQVGTEVWTTLPDAMGHTTQNTGQSCPASSSGGWRTLHPWLDHYQTQDTPTTCLPTGTTGAWHAASGDSHGWQQWSLNLGAYAGNQVEIRISYASDWATQGLGVFIDDVTLPDGTSTSFEGGDTGGWTASGPPPGSAPNANNFVFTTSEGFPEGAAVTTDDTIYFGFGFEGISGAANRNEVMRRAMDYFLSP